MISLPKVLADYVEVKPLFKVRAAKDTEASTVVCCFMFSAKTINTLIWDAEVSSEEIYSAF